LAGLLKHDHAAVLARARHSTKLFDDTKKGYETILSDVAEYHDAHRARFTGQAAPPVRWLETDLGVTTLGEHLVGTTITSHIHMGQPPTLPTDQDDMRTALTSASVEQGGALAVLLGLGGQFEPRPTLDLSPLRELGTKNRDTDRYLAVRYHEDFPTALKLVLLGIEADLGTCHHILPVLEPGHEDSVFRARVATVFHALNALREIAQRHPDENGSAHPVLADIVNDATVARLNTPEARSVRNRCVHYEIRGSVAKQLRPGRPMHGIVEAITRRSVEAFSDDVITATRVATSNLRTWTA
jgi:hypothetical protein